MIRALLGLIILGGMGSAGYLLLRPRIDRPAFTIGAHLPEEGSAGDAVERGARVAIEERDGRGGRFQVSYVRSPHCCWDRDNSNSSYAALGGWANGYLPGLEHPRLSADRDGNVLVSLPPREEGRRVAQAAPLLGYRSVLLASRRLRVVPRKGVKPSSDSPFVDLGIRVPVHLPMRVTAALSFAAHAPASLRVVEGTAEDAWEGAVEAVYLSPRAAESASALREHGFEGAIWVPGTLEESPPDGCLTILARLHPPPAEFVRRSGSADPFAWAAYRSCLRFLDALNRSKECLYDPFSDPSVATVGVYRLRTGGFELVTVLP